MLPPIEMMSTPWIQVDFLTWLVRSHKSVSILEIGCFTGRTTVELARASAGCVTAIESGKEAAGIARHAFAQEPDHVKQRLLLLEGQAEEILQGGTDRNPSFDFIYCDGGKQNYPLYFELCRPLVRPGGLFVADDVFFHGDVKGQTEKGAGVRLFNQQVREAQDFDTCVLPLFNGLSISRKLGAERPRQHAALAEYL